MNITKAIRNSDNKLVRIRHHDGKYQVRELAKGSKWVDVDINDYRAIKTRTIKCTWVDHSNPIKKTFKAGSRYQIEQGRVLGGVAGYIFDEDGDRWTLYREEAGFSAASTYLFEAKYF